MPDGTCLRAHRRVEKRRDAAESRDNLDDTEVEEADVDEQEATELPDREAMSLINPGRDGRPATTADSAVRCTADGAHRADHLSA